MFAALTVTSLRSSLVRLAVQDEREATQQQLSQVTANTESWKEKATKGFRAAKDFKGKLEALQAEAKQLREENASLQASAQAAAQDAAQSAAAQSDEKTEKFKKAAQGWKQKYDTTKTVR